MQTNLFFIFNLFFALLYNLTKEISEVYDFIHANVYCLVLLKNDIFKQRGILVLKAWQHPSRSESNPS